MILFTARQVARLSPIDARLMYGPPGHATASPRALRAPLVPDGPPADRRRHRQTPLNRRLPGLGGPQLLLASAVAIVKANYRSDAPADVIV